VGDLGYLLLWGWEKLEAKGEDKVERLEQLLDANRDLIKAYLLKEDVRLFWEQEDKDAASRFIDVWIADARRTKLKEIVVVANTMERNKERILAWYDHRITTGPLEGINNKIKVLKRRAYPGSPTCSPRSPPATATAV